METKRPQGTMNNLSFGDSPTPVLRDDLRWFAAPAASWNGVGVCGALGRAEPYDQLTRPQPIPKSLRNAFRGAAFGIRVRLCGGERQRWQRPFGPVATGWWENPLSSKADDR